MFLINHGAVSLPVFVVVVAHNPLIALHAEAEEEAREQEEETAKNPSPVVIVIDDGRMSVCVWNACSVSPTHLTCVCIRTRPSFRVRPTRIPHPLSMKHVQEEEEVDDSNRRGYFHTHSLCSVLLLVT